MVGIARNQHPQVRPKLRIEVNKEKKRKNERKEKKYIYNHTL